jgi:hypothetical protein
MIEHRHDHGDAASINQAGGPITPGGGSIAVTIVAPGPSWRAEFASRIDFHHARRDFRAWHPSDDARRVSGVGRGRAQRGRGAEAEGARRATVAFGPAAPLDTSTTAQTATDRPTTTTEPRQAVGDAPLLTLRRQK